MVESYEVVNVCMGNENMREPQDLAGRKSPDVSQVEKDSPAFIKKIYVHRRVVEGTVYHCRKELGRHGSPSFPHLMAKRGSKIVSQRQMGHLPGGVSLSRLAKTKPHERHSAGVTS